MSIGSAFMNAPAASVSSRPGIFLFTSPVNCTGLSITSWYACGFPLNNSYTGASATVEVGVFRERGSEGQFSVVPESITEITHSPTDDPNNLLCN